MTIKTVLSLALFFVVLGFGAFGGIALLLYLCDQRDAIAGIREYAAGAILGAVALVLIVAGIEKLFSYAARKYAEYKAASKVEPEDHGQGD